MLRPSTLLLALLVNTPVAWAAFVTHRVDVRVFLVHYIAAVAVLAVLTALLRHATAPPALRPDDDADGPGAARAPGPGADPAGRG